MSENSVRRDSDRRSVTSSPASEAAFTAWSGWRLFLVSAGCGPRKNSTSSNTLAGPTCWEKYAPPGRSTRAIPAQSVVTGWRLETRSNTSSPKGDSLGGHDDDPSRTQPRGRPGDVRRPRLGRRHQGRQGRAAVEDFTATGLQIERGVDAREPFAQQPLITPGRPLFGGAAVEP